MVNHLGAAAGELKQALGVDGVNLLPVMHIPAFGVAGVVSHFVHAPKHLGVLFFQNSAGIIGFAAI